MFSGKAELRNVPPKNRTVVVFGDSLVEGVGATKGGDFPSQLSRILGMTVWNYGKAGDTASSALARIDPALARDPGVAVVLLGGNDFLRRNDRDAAFSNLERIVRRFQDGGTAVVLVGVQSGIIGDGAGSRYEELAEKTGSAYVPDILDGLFGDTAYMSDMIHPNDAGYVRIADRIAGVILTLYR